MFVFVRLMFVNFGVNMNIKLRLLGQLFGHKLAHAQQQFEGGVACHGFQNARARADVTDPGSHLGQHFTVDQINLVEQDNVGDANLVEGNQLVAAGQFGQLLTIDHRQNAIHIEMGPQQGKGLGHGHRVGDATWLDHNVFRRIGAR